MTKDKKVVGKLPSERIDEILCTMLPKNYDDVMVNELRPVAIMAYLDEQSNLKQSEEK